MAFLAAASPSSSSSQLLLRPKIPKLSFPSRLTPLSFPNSPLFGRRALRILFVAAAKSSSNVISNDSSSQKSTSKSPSKDNDKKVVEEEEIEVEEELPWIQEKALDLVEFTGSVTQAIPGPRVGQSSLPWILALPLAYAGITFVIAFLKTLKKFSSPKEKRRRLVSCRDSLLIYCV